MARHRLALLGALALFLSACATTESLLTTEIPLAPDLHAVDLPAGRRLVLVRTDGATVKTCSEPSPDVADDTRGGLSLALTSGTTLGDQEADSAVFGAGRDPQLLIVREILFRACELTLNTNADYEQSVSVFQAALDALKALFAAEGAGTGGR